MLTDIELVEQRIIPCLNEMYLKSQSVFDFKVDFEMIGQYAPIIKNARGEEERKSVMGSFYLPKEDYEKILDKHTKDFQLYWYFPYNIEEYKKGEEFEQLKKDYEANPDNENLKEEYELTVERMEHDRLWNEYQSIIKPLWEDYENGKLSLKETRKKEAEVAKKYECTQRSLEKDKVAFNVSGFAPNSNKEYFDMVKNYYLAGASDNLIGNDTPQVNKSAFEDARIAKAFEENWRKNNKTTEK